MAIPNIRSGKYPSIGMPSPPVLWWAKAGEVNIPVPQSPVESSRELVIRILASLAEFQTTRFPDDEPDLRGPPLMRGSGVVASPQVVAEVQRSPAHWCLARSLPVPVVCSPAHWEKPRTQPAAITSTDVRSARSRSSRGQSGIDEPRRNFGIERRMVPGCHSSLEGSPFADPEDGAVVTSSPPPRTPSQRTLTSHPRSDCIRTENRILCYSYWSPAKGTR